MTPLYNHTSEETAYLVSGYPYSFKLRCNIKFWLEKSPTKGFRFCSRTEHPVKLIWNAPKKSTYQLLAGCMYLDDNGHCHWRSLTEYSSAQEVFDFITDFPGADLDNLLSWAIGKQAICNRIIAGKPIFGTSPPSEEDIARAQEDLDTWKQAFALLHHMKNHQK